MLAPSAREVTAGAAIGELPGLETFAASQPFAPIAREAFDWTPSYVAPEAPVAPTPMDAGESYASSPEAFSAGTVGSAADAFASSPEVVAAQQQQAVQQLEQQQQALQQIEHITTMRSALLSWNVESIVTPDAQYPQMAQSPVGGVTTSFDISAPQLTQLAPQTFVGNAALPIGQSMVEAMSLPMIGDVIAAQQPGAVNAFTPFANQLGQYGSTSAASDDTRIPTFAAPGMIAERAQAWSVAQERSSADLSFDFVTPELVLAARVYGLGPAEAAQAMRLAIAGPGQLATMASTVNRTFVQAMAIEAARAGIDPMTGMPASASGSASGLTTAYPTTSPSSLGAIAAQSAGASYGSAQGTIAGPFAMPAVTTTFGVDRRAPRGAFMWPSATVAALGLSAAAPDGEQGMPVAALELLAAQSVAALGTYAALGFGMTQAQIAEMLGVSSEMDAPAGASVGALGSFGRTGTSTSPLSNTTGESRLAGDAPEMATLAGSIDGGLFESVSGGAGGSVGSTSVAGSVSARSGASDAPLGSLPAGAVTVNTGAAAEPSDNDVLTAASSMVASSRRAKFEAMYIALGHSAQARSWSPAARAARALALAGRGDESITALERAQIAWSVLPLVAPSMFGHALGMDADEPGAVQSTGVATQRELLRRRAQQIAISPEQLQYVTESRPGLSQLSSRAGEALGSYVAPDSAPSRSFSSSSSSSSSSYSGSSGSSRREEGPAFRAPTAQPDYVKTGSGGSRSTGRFGGGEVEVPTWFEAAARKMLSAQQAGMGGDISLADLTLVTSAPSTHIAASERSAPSAAPATPNPSTQAQQQSAHQHIDIEKVANEVYKHILTLMDAARHRNGEPYL